MGRGMNQKTTNLVRYVASRIEQAYPGQSDSIDQTNTYIHEALASIAPFRPEKTDLLRLNLYLRNRRACAIACLAAWALYKDFIGIDAAAAFVNS